MKPKVYLCGPINGQTDYQCKTWRQQATELLKEHFWIIDPMDRDYRGSEAGNEEEIVAGDLAEIKKCQFILANCFAPSWGTAMEIALAHGMEHGPHIYAFGVMSKPSPWLVYHTHHRFFNLEDACAEMNAHKTMSYGWEN